MEIKEEMYARTLDGIMKIVELRDDGVMGRFRNEDGNIYFYNDMMCNPSLDVIDLIQVGDYVNGREVVDIFYNANDEVIGIDTRGSVDYVESQIKSILTKEQFESMSYKL